MTREKHPMRRLSADTVSLVQHVELNKAGWMERALRKAVSTLFWFNRDAATVEEIFNLRSDAGLTELSRQQIAEVVRSLCGDGSLIELGNERFRLVQHLYDELDQQVQEAEMLEGSVISDFCNRFEDGQISIDPRALWKKFHDEFLIPMVAFYGATTWEIVYGGRQLNVESPFAAKFFSTFPRSDAKRVREAINEFISPANRPFCRYALKLMNSYFFHTGKSIDRSIVNKFYSDRGKPKLSLVLDTNFVFSILNLHDNPSNAAAISLVEILKKSKGNLLSNLYLIPDTMDEMRRSLIKYEGDLAGLRVTSNLAAAANGRILSGIAQKYVSEAAKSPYAISAKDWFGPYIDHTVDVVRSNGIEILNEKFDRYREDQRVIDETLNQQQFLQESSAITRGRERLYEQIFHDMLLWHIIFDRQNKSATSVIDAGTVGVTIDYKLINYDRRRRAKLNRVIPCFVHPANLIQILQMFVGVDEKFEDAMAGALRLPFLVGEFDAVAEKTTIRILEKLSRFEHIEDLPEESIRNILVDQALRDKIDLAKEDDAELELIKEAVAEEYQTTHRELEQARIREAELLKRSEQTETQVRELLARADTLAAEKTLEQQRADAVAKEKEEAARTVREKERLLDQLERRLDSESELSKVLQNKLDVIEGQLAKEHRLKEEADVRNSFIRTYVAAPAIFLVAAAVWFNSSALVEYSPGAWVGNIVLFSLWTGSIWFARFKGRLLPAVKNTRLFKFILFLSNISAGMILLALLVSILANHATEGTKDFRFKDWANVWFKEKQERAGESTGGR